MLCCVVLCCVVLYCVTLYSAALCCFMFCRVAQFFAVLRCFVMYCFVLYCISFISQFSADIDTMLVRQVFLFSWPGLDRTVNTYDQMFCSLGLFSASGHAVTGSYGTPRRRPHGDLQEASEQI